MQIITNVALISINETLLFQLISFLVFVFVINRIMFRPLRETVRQREEYVERINQDIAAARKELESIVTQMKTEEEAVRNAAFKVCTALEKSAGHEADDILHVTLTEIAEMTAASRKDVETKLLEARKSIADEAAVLARSVMEKILGRKVAQ